MGYRITLSTKVYDLNGFSILKNVQNEVDVVLSRRVQSTKVLNGGVWVNDMGFSHGDSVYRYSMKNVSKSLYEQLSYLIKNHSDFFLVNNDGAFAVKLKNLTMASSVLTLSFTVVSSA
jgi:hypothetical protein